jgi:hypothetical protein
MQIKAMLDTADVVRRTETGWQMVVSVFTR